LENVKIRTLRKEDLGAMVEIERKVLGQVRKDYWEKKLETIDPRASQASFIAEKDGLVVGFILADVSGWEFGVQDTTGWIDTIGVDPGYQKKGLATALIQEVIKHLRSLGVKTIYTLVSWDDWDLLQFFRSMGFTRGDMINLELKI
jgi:ribosomal protein S18 acetylase RimI-like enzyme